MLRRVSNHERTVLVMRFIAVKKVIFLFFFIVTISLLVAIQFSCFILHDRGGGEFGNKWYHSGCLRKKENTFEVCRVFVCEKVMFYAFIRKKIASVQGQEKGKIYLYSPFWDLRIPLSVWCRNIYFLNIYLNFHWGGNLIGHMTQIK